MPMMTTWAERRTKGPVKGRVIGSLATIAAIGAFSVVAVTGAAGPAGASAGHSPVSHGLSVPPTAPG
jgi:hypothetical protein